MVSRCSACKFFLESADPVYGNACSRQDEVLDTYGEERLQDWLAVPDESGDCAFFVNKDSSQYLYKNRPTASKHEDYDSMRIKIADKLSPKAEFAGFREGDRVKIKLGGEWDPEVEANLGRLGTVQDPAFNADAYHYAVLLDPEPGEAPKTIIPKMDCLERVPLTVKQSLELNKEAEMALDETANEDRKRNLDLYQKKLEENEAAIKAADARKLAEIEEAKQRIREQEKKLDLGK